MSSIPHMGGAEYRATPWNERAACSGRGCG